MTGTAAIDVSGPPARRWTWLRVVLVCAMAFMLLFAGGPMAYAAEDEEEKEEAPSLLDNEDVLSGENVGRFNNGRYEIGYGDYDILDFDPAMLWGMLTEMFFTWGRWSVQIGLWVVEQAYSFDLVQMLTDPAVTLSNTMQERLIGPLGLNDFALFLAIAWSGYQLFRRRTGLGLGNLAISLLVAALGALLIANPAWLLRSVVPFAIQLSTEILTLATGAAETVEERTEDGDIAYDQAVRPLTAALHKALIDQPYDLIAWGALLEGECAEIRDEILGDENVDPTSDRARMIMRGGAARTAWDIADKMPDGPAKDAAQNAAKRLPGGDCAKHSEFHARATADRMGMAGINMLVSWMVIVLLGLIAVGIIAAQFILAAHLVAAPFAVAAGTVPGTGRQLGLRWAGNVGQALGVIVGMSFLLAVLLLVITTILRSGGDALIGRYLLLLVAVAAMFRMRKSITQTVQHISIRAAERLQTRDAYGRPIGLAPTARGVMGLEGTHVVMRGIHPVHRLNADYDRTVRSEVEKMVQ